MSGPARRKLCLAVTVIFLFAGCTSLANLHIPTPPPGSPDAIGAASTTVVSDLTGNNLPPVPSTPPTSVVLTPGTSSLSGVVTGPDGPVAGATVLIERLVNNSVGSKMVSAQADGTWKLTGILGGLYRVRAWQAPDFAMTTPQIVLLGAGANQSIPLAVLSFNGQNVNATVAPSPPQVGGVATLTIGVVQETVGTDGVVRASALPGANVYVTAAGNVVLAGTNPGTTDASGELSLALECSSVGPVGLTATVNGVASFPLTVADCSETISTITTPSTVSTTTSSLP